MLDELLLSFSSFNEQKGVKEDCWETPDKKLVYPSPFHITLVAISFTEDRSATAPLEPPLERSSTCCSFRLPIVTAVSSSEPRSVKEKAASSDVQ
jgi:hypothetical protein